MDQLIFASLSHTHYWYEVGMLKVGGEARKRCPIPILLLLVFSMSGVIVYSVFSCTISVPGGGAFVCL